jgi:inosine-uridine nucleoside N-ribohydrolase
VPRKIIIDTDPGIDDAMAILFALKSPALQVVGLTTIFGNVHTPLATENALRLIEIADQPHIPVAQGAILPLIVPLNYVADFVHGQDGLGNINYPTPKGRAIDQPAAQFIVEMIMAHPGEITLVPLGPLTNLALAIALEPRIVDEVAEVVLMGGAALVNGNVSPAAEANIVHDPHAADVVFSAGWPVTMVGLDVTVQTEMTADYLASLAVDGSPLGQFVHQITNFYVEFHRSWYGIDGAHTHDPSAVAYVIDPTLFSTITGPVRVVTEGLAVGQTIVDRRQHWWSANGWTNVKPATVCVTVDSTRLLALFKTTLHGSGEGLNL